jgi:hypothetical protein
LVGRWLYCSKYIICPCGVAQWSSNLPEEQHARVWIPLGC